MWNAISAAKMGDDKVFKTEFGKRMNSKSPRKKRDSISQTRATRWAQV